MEEGEYRERHPTTDLSLEGRRVDEAPKVQHLLLEDIEPLDQRSTPSAVTFGGVLIIIIILLSSSSSGGATRTAVRHAGSTPHHRIPLAVLRARRVYHAHHLPHAVAARHRSNHASTTKHLADMRPHALLAV